MPEWGNLPIPALLEQVCATVRLSDARMSGTHHGTCVCMSVRSAVGGPLALVRNGDLILDVAARSITLCASAGARPPSAPSGN